MCQSPSRSTIYICCLRRDQQLSQLPALLLTWKPLLRCRCTQLRQAQGSTGVSACAMSRTIYQVTGFSLYCGVHVRAQLAPLPPLVPPLRSSASAP